MRGIALNRFWDKVRLLPNGCWEWVGSRSGQGYGLFWVNGGIVKAHRFAYEHFYGIGIPKSLVSDHLCRNTWCVNPKHIEAVTQKVNSRRGDTGKHMIEKQAARTHCTHGHSLTSDNIYTYPNGRYQRCRICQKAARRRKTIRERKYPLKSNEG